MTAGQPLHLGKHTLILLMFRKTALGFGMFIASGIVAFLGPSIAMGVAGLIALGGDPSPSFVSRIAGAIGYLDTALFLLSVIVGMVGVVIALLQYRSRIFELDDLSIKIGEGIVSQIEHSVPYHHIKDVSIVRTAIHQLFGTSRLILVTTDHDGGGDSAQDDVVFDPIDADVAEGIRSFLESKISIQVIQSHA